MQDFTKLQVWQKATAFTVELERVLRRRTSRGVPGLRNQILRAAASIGANIAEGCGRPTAADFLRYLLMAFASANEVKNHLVLAKGVQLITAPDYERLEAMRAEVARMLWGLIKAVRSSLAARHREQ